jgi:hypothetical protein
VLLFFQSILRTLELLFVLSHVLIVAGQSVDVSAVSLLEGTGQLELIISVLLLGFG